MYTQKQDNRPTTAQADACMIQPTKCHTLNTHRLILLLKIIMSEFLCRCEHPLRRCHTAAELEDILCAHISVIRSLCCHNFR